MEKPANSEFKESPIGSNKLNKFSQSDTFKKRGGKKPASASRPQDA